MGKARKVRDGGVGRIWLGAGIVGWALWGSRRRGSDLAVWAELAWSEHAGWVRGAPRWERPEGVGTAAAPGLPLHSVAEQSVARLTRVLLQAVSFLSLLGHFWHFSLHRDCSEIS